MLKVSYTYKHGGVTMKTGEFYTFKYTGFENDPAPHIIFINKVEGIHPKTKHEHRYIQAINVNYLPREERKRFVDDWLKIFKKTKNVKFTWDMVKNKYPYLKVGIRRYFWKPPYYISKLEYLDTEKKIYSIIVGNWAKDFGKAIRSKLAKFFKRF